MRNFILKLNLFSLVFTMFFKLAALRQKKIYNFNHTGRSLLIIGYAELKVYDKLMVIRV